MYYVKFNDNNYAIPTLGKRAIPVGSIEHTHPDGTKIYVYTASQKDALLAITRLSKLCGVDEKYYEYAYNEFILDIGHPDVFLLSLEPFSQWHKFIDVTG